MRGRRFLEDPAGCVFHGASVRRRRAEGATSGHNGQNRFVSLIDSGPSVKFFADLNQ